MTPRRRTIRSVENTMTQPATRTLSKYTYAIGAEARRDNVTCTGEAFPTGKRDVWSYNLRQELIGTAVEQPVGTPLPAQNREYAYDPIGNRTHSRTGTDSPLYYCVNDVNQYEATAGAPECATPVETFGYDADGNLVFDGTYRYEWDGENRLKAVYKAQPNAGDRRLVFDYDYMSRRVRRRAFVWTGSAWPDPDTDPPVEDLRFVYDEWNVIMVLDGLKGNAIDRKYTWGLDLSGAFHRAGGIRGLLACEKTSGTHQGSYWYFYDANGNVGQLVSATSNFPITARYEYDAYGNALVATGTSAAANPFRFSTKWQDNETGLYYYGYRYYSPTPGRWISRDPVQEFGGVNVFAFVGNKPPDRVDALGLSCCPGDRYGGTTYARTCGLLGCGVQDCTDCYVCVSSETPTGWTSAWRRYSTNCGSCVWPSRYPGTASAPCPSGPSGAASGEAYTQCCNFVNGSRTATNCHGCCDSMYQGPPSVPPLDKFPGWSSCHAWCLQFPAQ
ncbi:MAG TPA: RHS repeat-associated core domain-containing protein [Phycisphaerae bacterium]|nr:RHS repeat-associated core domain-containing protein [Phycisphaerae bacterium]HQA46376.1 RHS repeat-associated core domain-containing protein [Phycisphaerae bacterium]